MGKYENWPRIAISPRNHKFLKKMRNEFMMERKTTVSTNDVIDELRVAYKKSEKQND